MQSSMIPTKDWVLCRIFKKKRAAKMNVDDEEYHEESHIKNGGGIGFIDFMGLQRRDQQPSSASSSESSCVTEPSDGSSSADETSCSKSRSLP